MTTYALSQYKYPIIPEGDFLATIDTEDYFKIGLDKFFIYFSPHLGILIKNLTTKITEKFDNNLKVTFIKAIEDLSTSNMLVTFLTDSELIIKKYDESLDNFKTFSKLKTFDKYHLLNYKGEIFLVYLNTTDNKIYYLHSSDNFLVAKTLTERVFMKQDIKSVGLDEVSNLPFVYIEVVDNTLLRGLNDHLTLDQNTFVEVYTHPKLYRKEVILE